MSEQKIRPNLPEIRINRFDLADAHAVPLTATNVLIDGPSHDQVYVLDDEGRRELVPPGMILFEHEYIQNPDGSRGPKRPIATGYVGEDSRAYSFGPAHTDEAGSPVLPDVVLSRFERLSQERQSPQVDRSSVPPDAIPVSLDGVLAEDDLHFAASQRRGLGHLIAISTVQGGHDVVESARHVR